MRSIRSVIAAVRPKTITVDIFDTVLLRKIYPEELQFYLHGRRAIKILREQVGIEFTSFAFASFRQSLRIPIARERQHQGFDGEAQLEEIFSLLIGMILSVQKKTISASIKKNIVDALIAEELALEKKSLRPNYQLVELLRSLKSNDVRVYFLSDMYLSRTHILELLTHFGIADIFDGGVTSSDLGYGKWSGRMPERILKGGVIGSFDPRTHVHIGDHVHADMRCAKALACEGVLLREWHHVVYRPFTRCIGHAVYACVRWCAGRSLKSAFSRALRMHMRLLSPDGRTLFRVGFEVFGPALLQYLSYLQASAVFGKRPIYFVSREAPLLVELSHTLWGQGADVPIYALPSLNRSSALRTFAYLALTRTAVRHCKGILELFWGGRGKHTVRDFLESMGLDPDQWDFPTVILERCDREEIVRILASLCDSPSIERDRLLSPLEKACHVVKNEINATDFLFHSRIIVGDVGWHGGIQVLLEEIVQLLGYFPDVRGIYLGKVWAPPFGMQGRKNAEGVLFNSLQENTATQVFVPEIWEQILSRGREGMLSYLVDGIEACFRFWITTSPMTATDTLLGGTARARARFFGRPSWDELRLLGSLEHDVGSGLQKCQPLVDMRFEHSFIWKMFFLKPKIFETIYNAQYWQRGFLRWYGLHLFARWKRCRTVIYKGREREQEAILRTLYEGPIHYAPLHVPLADRSRLVTMASS